jgi:aspartyl-tRNA(Asn)/glutamyl-tRNA(Gln) amidotransferase subunit A
VLTAAQELAEAGFEVIEAEHAPDLAAFTRQAGVLIAAEAWEQFGQTFRADPARFGRNLQRRLAAARDQSPDAVAAARTARRAATAAFEQWMAPFDALLTPAVPCAAPAARSIDESAATLGHFTRWVNHVGACAISLPAGFDGRGLPLAIQLVGRGGTDARVLGIAQSFQRITRWHRQVPPLDDFCR